MIKKIIPVIAVALAICGICITLVLRNNESPAESVPTEMTTETMQTVVPTTVPSKPQSEAINQAQYEQLQKFVEDGKSYDFALYLLNNEVSHDLFAILVNEDNAAIEYVIVDAMVSLAQKNQVREITMLRKNGFISDNCFLNYWEVMGSVLPGEAASGTDVYLIHELKQAYLRDSYVIRCFNLMRTEGILDDVLHTELVDVLGFDYTDATYVEQNQLSPLQNLTEEEKASYESVLEAIDQGDSLCIVEDMLLGGVSETVYSKLMDNDSEVMNYVIAEGMAHLMEMMRYQDVVRLRLEGFASDTCFANYWEILGCEQPNQTVIDQESDGVDTYLLYELEQIFHRENDGQEILQELWNTGLISDVMQQKLIQVLGFDYTQE